MLNSQFILKNNERMIDDILINRFDVVFPYELSKGNIVKFEGSNRDGIPKYLKIDNHFFKSRIANTGVGAIHICPDIEIDDSLLNVKVHFSKASSFSFFWYMLKHSKPLKYQMSGVIFLFIGIIIDSAILIGKEVVFFEIKSTICWLISGVILKILGAFLLIRSKYLKSIS